MLPLILVGYGLIKYMGQSKTKGKYFKEFHHILFFIFLKLLKYLVFHVPSPFKRSFWFTLFSYFTSLVHSIFLFFQSIMLCAFPGPVLVQYYYFLPLPKFDSSYRRFFPIVLNCFLENSLWTCSWYPTIF